MEWRQSEKLEMMDRFQTRYSQQPYLNSRVQSAQCAKEMVAESKQGLHLRMFHILKFLFEQPPQHAQFLYLVR
jgi:aminopeptidase C